MHAVGQALAVASVNQLSCHDTNATWPHQSSCIFKLATGVQGSPHVYSYPSAQLLHLLTCSQTGLASPAVSMRQAGCDALLAVHSGLHPCSIMYAGNLRTLLLVLDGTATCESC